MQNELELECYSLSVSFFLHYVTLLLMQNSGKTIGKVHVAALEQRLSYVQQRFTLLDSCFEV